MAEAVEGIQPSVLRWARESQGYSELEVAQRLKRDPSEIIAWESGEASPTYPQLEKLAYSVYKRPLAVFFLPQPPMEKKVKKQFRTLPDFELDRLSADTRYQIRLAHAFQISLRELTNGANPAKRKVFRDLRLSLRSDIPEATTRLRQFLGISLATQASWRTAEEAFRIWRNAVEEAGVFVFKHSFKQKDISGFCLFDDEFPIVYLNNSTTKTRQIFSLFHELTHLLLQLNSISKIDQFYVEKLPEKEQKVERFCNAFTAEFLIPSADFSQQIESVQGFTDESIQTLAKRYHVSREVVLRRVLDRGLIKKSFYEQKARQWAQEIQPRKGSGGDSNRTQAAYLGDGYMHLVFANHYQGRLSLEQVASYLGVKMKRVPDLEAILLSRAVSE